MANVRLIRQRLADYQKNINDPIEAYNKTVAGLNAKYNAEVDAYNKPYNDALAGGQAVQRNPDGKYALVQGVNGTLTPSTKTFVSANTPWTGTNGDQVVVNTKTGTANWYSYDNGKYVKGAAVPVIGGGVVPTAPVLPETPGPAKPLNLSLPDTRELAAPTDNPAAMEAMKAYGLLGNSKLAVDEDTSRSAFKDQEDPNNLKDRGILARTLGGQLGGQIAKQNG